MSLPEKQYDTDCNLIKATCLTSTEGIGGKFAVIYFFSGIADFPAYMFIVGPTAFLTWKEPEGGSLSLLYASM